MSWFDLPYSKKVLEREENQVKRRYGKVIKKVNELKEYESLPIAEHNNTNILDIIDDSKDHDENIDEKFDYSDLEE